jgi:glycosyltransferase involved in cell wall biosynthesis
MRIVLDLQACQASSMNRGIGRYSLALALAIVRNSAGHDLRVVVNSSFPDSAAALRKTFGGLLPATAISSFSTPLPTAESHPDNRWRLLAAERIREHYLASLRPDVVHVSSLFEGFGDNSVNSVLHGEGRFDTAVTLYDLIPLLRKERYLDDPNVAAWYYRKLESLKKAELLLAISSNAREEAIGALGVSPRQVVNISSAADDIFTVRTLAPQARADLLARHGLRRPFIMYTGGIDYRKNIEGLIEAYAALPGAVRRAYQLAVVCSIRDPDRVRLQRLGAKLQLPADDLVLTGYVSDDDLVSLYNSTALFVFPSLHEGFGLPVLEAMACGAPVIGANTSSIPEVIGRADAMFDPTSVTAITAAMARALGDAAYAQDLRTHGLAQAKRFSWDASAKRALAAFQDSDARNTTRTVVGRAPAQSPARARLALVAPAGSGNAEDGTGLLAALQAFYDIDLVVAEPWAGDGATLRAPAWFDAHAHVYDRIVYLFGNSASHGYLFDLLERHPGVIVLGDFFLGTARDHAGPESNGGSGYSRSLYQDHGYRALADEREHGHPASCRDYPCNRAVLERALGVVAGSADMLALAQHWYGADAARDWHVVPVHGQGSVDGALLHQAIEALSRDGRGAAQVRLLDSLVAIDSHATEIDGMQAAAAIAANCQTHGARQLLVDVTKQQHDPSGTGSCLGELIGALIASAPLRWRIEPVWHDGKRYRYARRFTLALIGRADVSVDDTVADAASGDILLCLDQDKPALLPPAWEARGVTLQQAGVGNCAVLPGRVLAQLDGA